MGPERIRAERERKPGTVGAWMGGIVTNPIGARHHHHTNKPQTWARREGAETSGVGVGERGRGFRPTGAWWWWFANWEKNPKSFKAEAPQAPPPGLLNFRDHKTLNQLDQSCFWKSLRSIIAAAREIVPTNQR